MIEYINIKDIIPAEYNPRKLSDDAFSNLADSIKRLGIIKPIIIRKENMTIVAGHQRSKVALSLGITETPAIFLNDIQMSDEIRFNQYHNMLEVGISQVQPVIKINADVKVGEFTLIDPKDIEIIKSGEMGAVICELSTQMLRYGGFANTIIDDNNMSIVSNVYGYTSKLLNFPLYVYKVKPEDVDYVRRVFAMDFGVFCYENTPKHVYHQAFAQMRRLSPTGSGSKRQPMGSNLYEKHVIPNITKQERVLDFGAGTQAYANMLNKKGYNIFPLEFFYRKEGSHDFDLKKVKADFDAIKWNVERYGLFDVVVLDSVMNSIHSLEAEKNVLLTVSALCKPNGKIFFSGRPLKAIKKLGAQKKTGMVKKQFGFVRFLDADGFTGTFRNGEWFYQKFHDDEQVENLARKYFSDKFIYSNIGASWQVETHKDIKNDPEILREALRYEFSLPLRNGKQYTLYQDNLEWFNKVIKLNSLNVK